MLQYTFKRFLLSLPALWLLVTLVFLLSRVLTGTPGEAQLLQDSGGFYSKGSASARQQAFTHYLERTGQNLPLFYFSVKPLPEPDTLHLVYPEHHRVLLKKLSWQYGKPEAATLYLKSINRLEQALPPDAKETVEPYFEHLYNETSPESITRLVNDIRAGLPSNSIQQEAEALVTAATTLTDNPQSYTYLLPSFRWHGSQNQYHTWLMGVLQGNFGISFRDGRPVNAILSDTISNTWWLVFTSIVLAFVISLELAMLLIRSKKLRRFMLPPLFIIDSIPLFLLALFLLVLLASPSFLQLFPVFGLGYHTSPTGSWLQRTSILAQYLALPVLCLTLSSVPYLANLIYRSFSEESKKDYARTAKAKGFSEGQVVRRQLLRNTLLPTITMLSDALPALVAGTVVVETIFAIPGMGRLLVSSVLARDYPVIVAVVLLVAVFRAIVYLLADVCYSVADPRIKHTAS